MSEESFVYTACPGWGDHDYCALKTIVKDGKIERMERIVYSQPEEPDGHICQKGCLAGRQPYDPKRLRKPLKRVGERGAGSSRKLAGIRPSMRLARSSARFVTSMALTRSFSGTSAQASPPSTASRT